MYDGAEMVFGLEYWFGGGGCCWKLLFGYGYGFGDEIGEMVSVYP